MAARKDSVQISIAFLTDESKQYAKLIEDNKKFINDIKAAQKEGKDLSKVVGEIVTAGKKVSEIDLDRVAPTQLTSRAKQLQQVIALIPKSRPEYAQLEAELKDINDRLATMRVNAKGVADDAGKGGLIQRILGVAGGVALFDLVKNGLQSLIQFGREALTEADAQLKADAQIREAIRSTAGVAGRSLQDLKNQAEELQDVTLFGDDQTEGAQALLLTFTNIRGEIFDNTIPIVQDLATAFKQDLNSSAIQVGKALNDPIKGVTALQRVGITFSQEQKKMIRTLVETNDVAGAQRIILAELERQVGGSARAAAQAGAGPLQSLKNVYGEIKEAIGGGLVTVLVQVVPLIRSMAKAFLDFVSVPVSRTLEQERQGFNGVSLQILNATVGTKERTKSITDLQKQYPQFLGNLNAEKVTNEELKPLLDKINQAYVIRIALQQQQEKIQPLLEAQAERENKLAESRATYNRFLARGAELSGINLQAFKTEAEQTQAVIVGLEKTASFRRGLGFSEPLNEQAKILNEIRSASSQIDASGIRQRAATQRVTEAEQQRQEVVEQLKKTYGELYDQAVNFGGADGSGSANTPAAPTSGITKEVEAARGSIKFLQEQISKLNEQIEQSPGETKILKPLIEKLKEAELQLKALEERIDRIKNGDKDILPSDEEIIRQLGGGLFKEGELTEEQRLAIASLGDYKILEEELTADELNRIRDGLSDEEQRRRDEGIEADKKRAEQKKEFEFAAADSISDAVFEIERNRIARQTDIQLAALDAEYSRRIAAAEGNSALQAKLQKELEAKKAAIEQDAARKRQASALKEAIVQGALAFIKALATNPFAAAGVAVATATQIAIIASQKFEKGVLMDPAKAKLGFFGGKPHSQGGTKGYFDDGTAIEVEKDEAFAVVNKKNAPLLRLLSRINSLGGNGVPYFKNGGLKRFDTGGLPVINTTPSSSITDDPISIQAAGMAQRIEHAAAVLMDAAEKFPKTVEAVVVYQRLEEAGADLNAAREDASI